MEHKTAQNKAVSICQQITPYTDICYIAGSIRRLVHEVNDIEIVCLPTTTPVNFDLFGKPTEVARDAKFIEIVNALGKVIKGNAEHGRYMQIELPEGIKLDLFMPQPEDYYRILTIRTGSANYVRNIIAKAWVAKGWVGTADGLRKATDCIGIKGPDGKVKWTVNSKNPELPPVWQNEADFFEWLGVKYIEERLRF